MNFFKVLCIILFLIILVILIDMIIVKLIRTHLSSKYFKLAEKRAEETNKKLMVIGDPCIGNYKFVSFLKPDTGHGDITVDLYGCDKCIREDVNNMKFWQGLETNAYVIYETGTISFSKDLIGLVKELDRITGGDFYTSAGTNSLLWKLGAHNLYSNNYSSNITFMYSPYNPEQDDTFKCYNLFTKKEQSIKLK